MLTGSRARAFGSVLESYSTNPASPRTKLLRKFRERPTLGVPQLSPDALSNFGGDVAAADLAHFGELLWPAQ